MENLIQLDKHFKLSNDSRLMLGQPQMSCKNKAQFIRSQVPLWFTVHILCQPLWFTVHILCQSPHK